MKKRGKKQKMRDENKKKDFLHKVSYFFPSEKCFKIETTTTKATTFTKLILLSHYHEMHYIEKRPIVRYQQKIH
jgi:hypothetical protein